MRLVIILTVGFLLTVLLDACSTYGGLFTGDSPSVSAEGASVNYDCARLAARRADDAVMAFYVDAGSPGERKIYEETYRACVEWAAAH